MLKIMKVKLWKTRCILGNSPLSKVYCSLIWNFPGNILLTTTLLESDRARTSDFPNSMSIFNSPKAAAKVVIEWSLTSEHSCFVRRTKSNDRRSRWGPQRDEGTGRQETWILVLAFPPHDRSYFIFLAFLLLVSEIKQLSTLTFSPVLTSCSSKQIKSSLHGGKYPKTS